MGNRREFLQAGVATVTAAAAAALTPSLATARDATATGYEQTAASRLRAHAPLYKVLYDERFPAAVQFAVEARRLGANPVAIRGDVTDLWYHDLHRRWATAPAAIAGMTTYYSMFVLDMMARDAGMRLVYQAVHRPGEHGDAVTHSRYGPAQFLVGQPDLDSSAWPSRAASIVMSWGAEAAGSEQPTSIGRARERSIGPDALISWIIAPVRRGAA